MPGEGPTGDFFGLSDSTANLVFKYLKYNDYFSSPRFVPMFLRWHNRTQPGMIGNKYFDTFARRAPQHLEIPALPAFRRMWKWSRAELHQPVSWRLALRAPVPTRSNDCVNFVHPEML